MKDSRITFTQLKRIVAEGYRECAEGADEDKLIFSCKNMDELIDALDNMGFNGNMAYEFIIDSLVKPVKG